MAETNPPPVGRIPTGFRQGFPPRFRQSFRQFPTVSDALIVNNLTYTMWGSTFYVVFRVFYVQASFMNHELILALNRLAAAHEKLADGVTRIADALKYNEGSIEDHSTAEGAVFALNQIASALSDLRPPLPED